MSELLDLFKNQGKSIEAPANFRLSLKEKGHIWLLEKGSMILFAVEKKGEVEGRRILLSTLETGDFIFPMELEEESSFEIFAFSEQEVSLKKLPLDHLKGANIQEEFSYKLDHWIHQFSSLVVTDIEVKVDQWAFESDSFILKKGEIFSMQTSENPHENKGVLWGDFEGEVVKLLGPFEIKIPEGQKNFPFIAHQYFLGLEDGVVQFKTTLEIVEDGSWKKGITEFHTFLLNLLLKKQLKMSQIELKRFQEKEELQLETLHDSLNQMASILKEDMTREKTKTSDPLFQACFLVGMEMGVELTLPERKPFKGTRKQRLERIASTSNIRIRLANLKSGWEKKDSGPLLGFYGKEQLPVALLQNKWGIYEIHDPTHGFKKRLGSSELKKLSEEVYSFYINLPDDFHSGKKVIQTFFKRNRKDLSLLFLYGLIAAVLALFPPFAMGMIFNNAIPNANIHMLVQIFAGLLVGALSSSIFIYFRSLMLGRLGGRGCAQVQSSLWDRLLKLPANFFRRYDGGDLLTRVWIMDQLTPLFSSDVARVILSGVFALFYLIAMAFYSIKLTFVGIFILLLSLGITYLSARYKIKMQKKVLALQGQINGALVQILSGIAKLRVAGAENNAFSYWASLYAKSKHYEMKGQHAQSFVAAAMTAFPLLSFLVIFAVVIQLEAAGNISTGAFLAYNSAFLTFSAAVFDLNNTLMQVAQVFPFLKRSKVILEEKQEFLTNKSNPGKLTGDIQIDHVSFGYDQSSELVLQDVSIKVHPREMVGIVGPSGSGKSTLIRLILGFEVPNSGAVYYNGKDLSHLSITEVRKQMGVVLQGGGIIAGTLYQNIVAGGRYSQEEIDRAIRLSGFHRDLDYFPMGLHTMIPMNGETLSGGQKQRLLIARALLPRPKILLLDEATSALDNKSQNEISSNIDQLDITRIVIAHRLSTIRNANRIYVIQEGRVSQSGTFDELAKEKGLFSDMLRRQKL